MVLTRPNNLSRFPSTSPETKLQPRKSQPSNHWSRHRLAKKSQCMVKKKLTEYFRKINIFTHVIQNTWCQITTFYHHQTNSLFSLTILRHTQVNCASKDQTAQSSPKNYLEQCWVTLFFIFCNRLNSLGNICKPNLSNIF